MASWRPSLAPLWASGSLPWVAKWWGWAILALGGSPCWGGGLPALLRTPFPGPSWELPAGCGRRHGHPGDSCGAGLGVLATADARNSCPCAPRPTAGTQGRPPVPSLACSGGGGQSYTGREVGEAWPGCVLPNGQRPRAGDGGARTARATCAARGRLAVTRGLRPVCGGWSGARPSGAAPPRVSGPPLGHQRSQGRGARGRFPRSSEQCGGALATGTGGPWVGSLPRLAGSQTPSRHVSHGCMYARLDPGRVTWGGGRAAWAETTLAEIRTFWSDGSPRQGQEPGMVSGAIFPEAGLESESAVLPTASELSVNLVVVQPSGVDSVIGTPVARPPHG